LGRIKPDSSGAVFEPGGVAHRHLGWDVGPLAELRRQLAWFIGLVFPVYFVLLTSIAVETRPATSGGTLTLLSFVAVLVGLVALIIGIGHPAKGVVGHLLASRSGSAGWRWRYLWFPVGVLVPVALVALALFGFTYTAEDLMRRLFQSIWALAAIWLGAALGRRWLLLTSRRLARQEAVAAGDADRALQDGQGGGGSAIAAVGGAQEREESRVLADGQQLAIAERPALRCEVAGKHADLSYEGIRAGGGGEEQEGEGVWQ